MGQRFGFVSTYPPTQCGLATFTASLNDAMTGSGAGESVVVRVLDEIGSGPADWPGAHLVHGDVGGLLASVELLNSCDAVVVQHEYGIYGGPDGEDVIGLLALLRVPTVVVLHTVLLAPTGHQREVLEAVVAAAGAVVTMTGTAHERLAAGYAVDMTKVRVIAHGVPDMGGPPRSSPPGPDSGPLVLTWGLLGPGKGVEWGVRAMALLRDLRPAPRYVIAGQTHPKVLAREGEAYRRRIVRAARERGVETAVRLDGVYRDRAALVELVASADVVLLPYDSVDQVTSGVLSEAVAAGKPVVATRFPHAIELLADGAGILVPHRDPAAIADALRTILTRRDVAASMSAKGASTMERLLWPEVGARYRDLVAELLSRGVAA